MVPTYTYVHIIDYSKCWLLFRNLNTPKFDMLHAKCIVDYSDVSPILTCQAVTHMSTAEQKSLAAETVLTDKSKSNAFSSKCTEVNWKGKYDAIIWGTI